MAQMLGLWLPLGWKRKNDPKGARGGLWGAGSVLLLDLSSSLRKSMKQDGYDSCTFGWILKHFEYKCLNPVKEINGDGIENS